MKTQSLDTFTKVYIETALWSSTDESTPQGGEPLDHNYSASDISEETGIAMDEKKYGPYKGANGNPWSRPRAVGQLPNHDYAHVFIG